jgi:hypothetical protein
MICNEKGNCWEDQDEIGKAFVDYFTTLFTTEQADNLETCLDHLEVKVTAEMNLVLLQSFSEVEVCEALNPQSTWTGWFERLFCPKKLVYCQKGGLRSCSFVFEFGYYE